MTIRAKLMRAYFDYAYNPIYDFTTARLERYRRLQKECINKFVFHDGDRILCVGLGTGNELLHIMEVHKEVSIVGIDYSRTALRRGYEKVRWLNGRVDLLHMDARSLEFEAGTFNKVMCIHVMDFISEKEQVTSEIVRVLKDGGQFVITYPSDREGVGLGFNLFKDSVREGVDAGKTFVRAALETLAELSVGIVYLPLLLRPGRKAYSRPEMEALFRKLLVGSFEIDEDSVYQDFIVYGKK